MISSNIMRIVILVTCLVLFAFTAFALENVLDTYYEFGRKSSSGLVDEEDLTDEFYYSKYNIKFSQKISKPFSYYVKYQYYNKDFDTLENLDNNFHSSGIGIDATIYKKDGFSIKIGPDFEFKEKIYNDSPDLNYDQIKIDLPFIFKKEGDWTIKLIGGMNSYHYPDAPKDQLKFNSRIDVTKKFFDEKLEIYSFYKFQYIDREKIADRLERTYGASFDIKVNSQSVKSIGAGIEQGMDNTIIYEEREDSFDFKYFNWYLNIKYELFEKMKGAVKYTDLTRVYADLNHNFDGFMIENNWDTRAYETKDSTFDIKLGYLHKQFRYPYVSSPFAFHNNAISAEGEFTKKNDWRATIDSEVRFWDYPAKRMNDKIYYIEKIGIEKYFLKKDLTLGFDYRYTFKNFLHKLDITEYVFRFHVNYKF